MLVKERPSVDQKTKQTTGVNEAGQSGTEAQVDSLWARRDLIALMVKREFSGKYRGAILGTLWPVINPLGHLILYTFLFCVVLKVRLGSDATMGNFALYLMAGLLPWSCLAESLSRSTTAILESPNLVKKVVFPLEIIPVVLVISSLISELPALGVLFVAAAIALHKLNFTVVFLPLILVSQVLFIAGLSWLLASMGVFIRDLRHVMSLALSAWMYATPIVYPATALPAQLKFLLWLNPMAGMVMDYRHILLEGTPLDWPMYATYTTVAVLTYLAGYRLFMSTKKSFADVM